MKSPQERYSNDAAYRRCVDVMTASLIEAQFTPSEMREMAMMASINYELRYGFRRYTLTLEVNDALQTLVDWRKKEADHA